MIRGAAQHTFGHELNGLKAAHILAIRGRYLVSAGAEVLLICCKLAPRRSSDQ